MNPEYLEDYFDILESLPIELQRNFSLIRELDAQSQDGMKNIKEKSQQFMLNVDTTPPHERLQMLKDVSSTFQSAIQHGEEKVALATLTYDLVDRYIRQLDEDLLKFEEVQMTEPKMYNFGSNYSKDGIGKDKRLSTLPEELTPIKKKKQRETFVGNINNGQTVRERKLERTNSSNGIGVTRKDKIQSSKEKVSSKKRESSSTGYERNSRESSYMMETELPSSAVPSRFVQNDMPIDPNEPTYCYCGQVSYGEMVACDDENCEIEWFHYNCVGLKAPPRGRWYCQDCIARRRRK